MREPVDVQAQRAGDEEVEADEIEERARDADEHVPHGVAHGVQGIGRAGEGIGRAEREVLPHGVGAQHPRRAAEVRHRTAIGTHSEGSDELFKNARGLVAIGVHAREHADRETAILRAHVAARDEEHLETCAERRRVVLGEHRARVDDAGKAERLRQEALHEGIDLRLEERREEVEDRVERVERRQHVVDHAADGRR